MISVTMKALLIMPARNLLEFTKQAVNSIIENAEFPFEIVLIDNGSTDGTQDFFTSSKLPNVKYIRNQTNQSFAKAINQGLSFIGDASHIGILNNDILVYKGWLKRLVAHLNDTVLMIVPLQAHGVDERQCIESVYNIRAKYSTKWAKLLNIEKDWTLQQINEHLVEHFSGKTEKLRKSAGFYSCFMERKTFDQIGFLDEEFINGGEDDDYARRVENAGGQFHVALDVCIKHFGSKTINQTGIIAHRWNVYRLHTKHPEFYKKHIPKTLEKPVIDWSRK